MTYWFFFTRKTSLSKVTCYRKHYTCVIIINVCLPDITHLIISLSLFAFLWLFSLILNMCHFIQTAFELLILEMPRSVYKTKFLHFLSNSGRKQHKSWLLKVIFLFSKAALNWSKVTVKTFIIMLQTFSVRFYRRNALLSFLLISSEH